MEEEYTQECKVTSEDNKSDDSKCLGTTLFPYHYRHDKEAQWALSLKALEYFERASRFHHRQDICRVLTSTLLSYLQLINHN